MNKRHLCAVALAVSIPLFLPLRPIFAGGASQAPAERFVPSARSGSVLEFRSEVTVRTAEITLRQVCRWADSDANFFMPMADLIVARCDPKAAFASVSLDDVRRVLTASGANLAMIHFSGALNCTISRSNIEADPGSTLQQWIDAKEGKIPATTPVDALLPATTQQAAKALSEPRKTTSAPVAAAPAIYHSLRDLLINDLSVRLRVPVEGLQLNFNPADEKVLALSEPLFKFNLDGRQVYNLGDVAWDVQIVTDTGSKKARIAATAWAWESQLLVNKPIAYQQMIQDNDLTEHRLLVNHLTQDSLITRAQAIGQQAAQELKPGMILTGRMIDPVQLVKTGQEVSIFVTEGGIQIKSTARAMESGSFGQLVRVKNEGTGETFHVTVTGSQAGTLSAKGTTSRAE